MFYFTNFLLYCILVAVSKSKERSELEEKATFLMIVFSCIFTFSEGVFYLENLCTDLQYMEKVELGKALHL